MPTHLIVTIPSSDPALRRQVEQGVEEYADVTQAKSYTDLETLRLVLDLVDMSVGIVANVGAILLALRELQARRTAQGHDEVITVGAPGGEQVPAAPALCSAGEPSPVRQMNSSTRCSPGVVSFVSATAIWSSRPAYFARSA
jgi:hypothetical protein